MISFIMLSLYYRLSDLNQRKTSPSIMCTPSNDQELTAAHPDLARPLCHLHIQKISHAGFGYQWTAHT